MSRLPSIPMDDALRIVWSPPGPFTVEIDEGPVGFNPVSLHQDFLSATRKASQLLRGWQLRGDQRRIRLVGPDGPW